MEENATTPARRILHINTPQAILQTVAKLCASAGVKVDSVESGATGLHWALVQKYQLILLGQQIPKLSMTRILAGLERAGIDTPVVLLADPWERQRRELASLYNVVDVLERPIQSRLFLELLRGLDRPRGLSPAERERLLGVLDKVEAAVRIAP